ncbi:MAG: hypothetical protein AAGU17_13930, partial [Anaerolineaceae bacterium]
MSHPTIPARLFPFLFPFFRAETSSLFLPMLREELRIVFTTSQNPKERISNNEYQNLNIHK